MAKYIYPAVFAPEDGGYTVNFPDFESCYTSADTLEEGQRRAVPDDIRHGGVRPDGSRSVKNHGHKDIWRGVYNANRM